MSNRGNKGKRLKKPGGIGFTNKLALLIIFLIFVTICMGFYLAVISVRNAYLGSLVVFSAATSPLSLGLSAVLNAVVKKSAAENTGPDGAGIVFAAAAANNFNTDSATTPTYTESTDTSVDSPPI